MPDAYPKDSYRACPGDDRFTDDEEGESITPVPPPKVPDIPTAISVPFDYTPPECELDPNIDSNDSNTTGPPDSPVDNTDSSATHNTAANSPVPHQPTMSSRPVREHKLPTRFADYVMDS